MGTKMTLEVVWKKDPDKENEKGLSKKGLSLRKLKP
jgi:hypothetical protein